MSDQKTTLGGPSGQFPETAHDLLRSLRSSEPEHFQAAMGTLCRRYWKPVYVYVRTAWAKSNEDAKDLTQAYFLWLLESESLANFDPSRGTFRGYLKGTLRSFVGHQHAALAAIKRGGDARIFALDGAFPALEEVADRRVPDPAAVFDQSWMVELLNHAVERVRETLRSAGMETALRIYEEYVLDPSNPRPTYLILARRYHLKEREVEACLERVRLDIRREIRALLSETTSDPRMVEEEWNELFGR